MNWIHDERKNILSMLAMILAMIGIIILIITVFNWETVSKQPEQITEAIENSPASEIQTREDADPVVIISEPAKHEEKSEEYQNIDSAHDYNNFENIIMEISNYTKE